MISFKQGESIVKDINLTIEGLDVHYYELGNNTKPTIVCLHGLGNSGAVFSELAEYLEDDFHILSFDNPGHGRTAPFVNENGYLFSNIAKWYNNVFQQVLKAPFYILGHSWGADIALHYAKMYPEKIKGIILLDGGYTFPDFQEDMTFSKVYDGWNDYMENSSVFDTWHDVIGEYKQYTERWNEKIEQMVQTLLNKKEKYELINSKFTVLSIIKAFFKESFTTTYPYIKSPLILIHATLPEDLNNARRTGINKLKQHIENVTIVSMEETGHMVHWDNPKKVANEIHNWVSKC
ncbi:alpha/beta hydrolase [Bacillus cereus]|nr:alpha/beta hydrolase [Bacillus cereus]PFW09525.1 alpha/beta hydrolase [Bacillus cereus]PGX01749.1 alpha/beta hydrolase [Bacillus cereus]PGY19816.1 alpha/beta hydrolase [Bacillus cereus]